mmetsp:Transcript_21522/g.71316  ORF Transcript_21522/g.71316 Transcript_21522/m.71316 type:complete len:82 (+) Transcript_21522:1759-2004(+)
MFEESNETGLPAFSTSLRSHAPPTGSGGMRIFAGTVWLLSTGGLCRDSTLPDDSSWACMVAEICSQSTYLDRARDTQTSIM